MPAPSISVSFNTTFATCLVTLRGEQDTSTALRVERELHRITRTLNCRVVVDLSVATFVDSSIVNVLLLAGDDACRHGGSLRLVLAPGTEPRRLADLLNLPEELAGYANLHDALASLATQDRRQSWRRASP